MSEPAAISWALQFVLASTATYAAYWVLTFRPARFPPGPTPVPFLGTLINAPTRLEAVSANAKKYGPVHSMSLQSVKPVVVVEDYEVYKEDIKGNAPIYANRPRNGINSYLGFDKGIVQTNGAHWLAARKYALAGLRENGVGTKGLIQDIVSEADYLVSKLDEVAGKPSELRVPIQYSITNMVSCLIFGQRYKDNDPELESIISVLESQDSNTETLLLRCMMEYEFLTWIPTFLLNRIPGIREFRSLMETICEKVKGLEAKLDPKNPRGLVDMWLVELERQKSTLDNEFLQRMDVLVGSIMDLFFAGIETTSMTINWATKYLATCPELQEKIHEEIVREIGPTHPPESTSISKLHLLNAFVHEVLRHSSIAPQGVEHCTTGPAKIGAYHIPAGTTVFMNLYSVHHDPRYWKSPDSFDPANFLDDSGKFRCPQQFMAFGFGNRICIGQQLAKAELYVYMVRIIQRYIISPAAGDGKGVNLEAWGDFLRRPTDSPLLLTRRY